MPFRCQLHPIARCVDRRFLSEATGLFEEQVEEECDREQFCSPQRAIELGLIDGVVE